MKKILFGFVLTGLSLAGYSQQLFQTTQFMVNPYTLNPALAGSEDFLDIKAGYRNQWSGLVESDNYLNGDAIHPRTMYLSAHTAIGQSHEYYRDPRHERQNFHGVGGFVMKDDLGAFSSLSAYGSYSYNMLLVKSKKGGQMFGFNGRTKNIGLRMVLGAHLGFIQQAIDFSKLVDVPGGIPGNLTDKGLNGINRESAFAPDASLGAWFYTNYFFGGVAIRRVLGNNVGLPTSNEFTLQRHYNLMAGYKFFLSNTFLLEPSAVTKIEGDLRLTAFDLNLRVAYDNTYTNKNGVGNSKKNDINVYAGTTFRPGSAVAFLLGGVFMRKYEVAYSFDLTSNQLGPYENGTHEVTVGYRIQPGKVFRTAETHHNHFK